MSWKPIQERTEITLKLKQKNDSIPNERQQNMARFEVHLRLRRHLIYLSLFLIWKIFHSSFRQPKLEIWMNSSVCSRATIHGWPWKMCGAERLRIKRPPEIVWIFSNLFIHNKAVSNFHKTFRFAQYRRFRFCLHFSVFHWTLKFLSAFNYK